VIEMILYTGVDLVEIDRIRQAVDRHGERFLQRVYTSQELEDCGSNYKSLAVRFAAKEAVSKAFGTGIGEVGFKELEIVRLASGAPEVRLLGKAAELATLMGILNWSISLSHSENVAVAFVIGYGV
jgi:holo-[acyl-carrier protein] synthase